MSNLTRRGTNLEEAEFTPFAHRYLIKRPITKDICDSRDISLQNSRNGGPEPQINDAGRGREGAVIRHEQEGIDNPMVEKRRFELFIDLIWVGIIGNLAEHYSEQAFTSETDFTVGEALGEFILLFMIAVRLWKNLQEFTTKYHTNDFVERFFLIVYLSLAMVYGNTAPYILDVEHPSNMAIIVYLIAQGALTSIEFAYSVFLPSQRRGIIGRWALVGLPALPFFIVACFKTHDARSIFLAIGITLQFALTAVVASPYLEKWLKDEFEQSWDADHWVERIQDFFIIILGEAVLNLIRGSPLGSGVSVHTGAGILALCQYYMISGLFFNGDSSRRYIHAVKRQFWRKSLYMFSHSVLFFSALTLGVSVVYLVKNAAETALEPVMTEGMSEEAFKTASETAYFVYNAKWSASISLTGVVKALTAIALLNRSLDPPKTLMITNRYIRLFPRLLLIIVMLCLPIIRKQAAIFYLTIGASLLALTVIWELTVSLERQGGIIEP